MKFYWVLALLLSLAAPLRAADPKAFELRAVASKASASTQEFSLAEKDGADEQVFLERELLLDGKAIHHATASPAGLWRIDLTFTDEGGKQFGEITTKYLHQKLAILIGGKLISVANVNEPIRGGRLSTASDFTEAEATNMANLLNEGVAAPPAAPSAPKATP